MKSFAYKMLCGERVCVSHVVSFRRVKIRCLFETVVSPLQSCDFLSYAKKFLPAESENIRIFMSVTARR